MKKENSAYIILFIVAFIWGGGYIASQQAFNNGWTVFGLLFQRNIIGFIITFAIGFKTKFWKDKKTLLTGLIGGTIFFVGYAFQLIGQQYTTVSNTALLSGLGIILVPIFYWIAFKKKPPTYAFIATGVGIIGAFILSYNPGFEFHFGDILVILGAICYAIQLTYIGKEGDETILIGMVCTQFGVMAILSGMSVFASGTQFIGESKGWIGVLYYAILSGVVGMLGQFYCQRIIDSYKVSLILTTESLFAAILSIILLDEPVTIKLIIGGSLMFFSAVFTQVCDIVKTRKELQKNLKTEVNADERNIK